MRQLSAAQKKRLKKLFEEAPEGRKPFGVDDIEYDDYAEIEDLNPHETFHQNANQFISDLFFDWQRNQ